VYVIIEKRMVKRLRKKLTLAFTLKMKMASIDVVENMVVADKVNFVVSTGGVERLMIIVV